MQFDISSLVPSQIANAALALEVNLQNSGGGSASYTYNVEVWGLNDGCNEAWIEGTGQTGVTARNAAQSPRLEQRAGQSERQWL